MVIGSPLTVDSEKRTVREIIVSSNSSGNSESIKARTSPGEGDDRRASAEPALSAAWVPGRVLRAVATADGDAGAAASVLGRALAAAGLGWTDVMSPRLCVAGEGAGEAKLAALEAALAMERGDVSAEAELRPQLVEASAVAVGGVSAEAALELSAWGEVEEEGVRSESARMSMRESD